MTFGQIYRQVKNKLETSNVDQQRFFHNDLVDSINDAIRAIRTEYIHNGLGNEFVETERIYIAPTKDFEFPFLGYGEIEYPILRSLPPEIVIRQSLVWKGDELKDKVQEFSKGNKVVKGDKLYIATEDVNENSFTKTFQIGDIRTYYPGNGITFVTDDIVKDVESGSFFRVTADYDNVTETDIGDIASFEKVIWKEIGGGFAQARHVDFTHLHMNKLALPDSYSFTVQDDTIYTNFTNQPFSISYIPEWQRVYDFDELIKVPDRMLPDIQVFCLQHLIGTDDTS